MKLRAVVMLDSVGKPNLNLVDDGLLTRLFFPADRSHLSDSLSKASNEQKLACESAEGMCATKKKCVVSLS